jgi:peptidoglycan/LPS O-acetylase OafA/YrhL
MQRRIPELDGLRAIAVTMVLLWHYVGVPGGGSLYAVFRPGRSGVDLFFVLSGFLITSILIKSRGDAGYFTQFYIRRALRILPVYVVMLAIFFAGRLAGWHEGLFGGGFATWTYAAFLQNFEMSARASYGPDFLSATWSLAIEEQFYLVFPLLVAALPNRVLPKVLVTIIVVSVLLKLPAHTLFNHYAAYTLMPCRADALAVGALVAWCIQDQAAHAWLREHRQSILRVCVALLCVFPVLWIIPGRSFALHMAAWGYSYLAALYATILLTVLMFRDADALWLLRTSLARGLAECSYALYLFHYPILVAVFALADMPMRLSGVGSGLMILLAAALSIGLSVVSLQLIERPFLRLNRGKVSFDAPVAPLPVDASPMAGRS